MTEWARFKLLVVEDDDAMAVALRDGLSGEGYEVSVAADGQSGLEAALRDFPDLVVLDVMLPKLDGLAVCREIRAAGSAVPIIMLTARNEEADKVSGLKLGADDYMTKPFSFLELAARVQAVLRRAARSGGEIESCQIGGLSVDFRRHRAERDGAAVRFSALELRLLRYLAARRAEVVSREELLEAVWGYRHGLVTRTVDMHVAKLRKKIEDRPKDPRFLLTIHGSGYKLV